MLFNNPINYANIFSGFVSIVVSFIILFKNRKEILNILFFSSLFCWGISLLLNGFNFLYLHPVLGAKIIRDFVTSAGSIASFLIFTTALSIYVGGYLLKKYYVIVPIIIIMIINTVIASYFDYVKYDSPNDTDIGNGIKTTQEAWVMIFLYVIPVIMICLAIFFFIKTRSMVKEDIIKKRTLFFIFCFVSIIIGVLIYGMGGIIEQVMTDYPMVYEYVIWILAEIFWTIAPILLLVGFFIGRVKENNYSKNIG